MKKQLIIFSLAISSVIIIRCNTPKTENASDTAVMHIKAVPLPDPGIPGYTYPEDSTKLTAWIDADDEPKMNLHGWGIWTALNSNSGEKAEGQDLRVFETWLTPDDMIAMMHAENSGKTMLAEDLGRNRGRLHKPNQFMHLRELKAQKKGVSLSAINDPAENARISGFVKYDPTAAAFAVKNKLFDSTILRAMLNSGQASIPEFPHTGMTIKPNFEFITQDSLKKNGGYYKLNVWTGPPSTPQSYGEGTWPAYVYVDPSNKGQGNGGLDTGQGRTPQNTYNLSDFVSFQLDQQSANDLKAIGINATKGDIALLVAMHVTSKEIKRWTWQTFWWAPNADNPPLPSSAAIAAQRPAKLTGAQRHYAMAQAYTFTNPNQPYSGGNKTGTPIYAYNPYLEASFAGLDTGLVITNGIPTYNTFGVQTNCMSCHAHANFPGTSTTISYIGDTYIDMKSPAFKNTLQLDFAWSIQQHLTGSK